MVSDGLESAVGYYPVWVAVSPSSRDCQLFLPVLFWGEFGPRYQTATTPRMTRTKVSRLNGCFVSAITLAEPNESSLLVMADRFNGCQEPEFCAGKV